VNDNDSYTDRQPNTQNIQRKRLIIK